MQTLTVAATIDARGLNCPMPIVRTAQAMNNLIPGELAELLATDAGSVKDVAAWSRATGNELVEQSQDAGVYRFVLRRKQAPR